VSDLIQGFEAKEKGFHSELYKKRNLKKKGYRYQDHMNPKKKSKQETEIKTKFCQNNP
jgi:hypothetical protein